MHSIEGLMEQIKKMQDALERLQENEENDSV